MKLFFQFCIFLLAAFCSEVLSDKKLDTEELSCVKQKHKAEIMFMRQVGQEASEHYANERFFDPQWIEEIETEEEKFTSFKTFGVNSGGRRSFPRAFLTDWDTEENHLGSYSEPGFKIGKAEVVKNGQFLTIYLIELTPTMGSDYEVYGILESDQSCLED